MIVETYDERKTTVLKAIWKFNNDEQDYSVFWKVCDNPFCECSEMTFGIEAGDKPVGSFTFDVVSKEVLKCGSGSSGGPLSERLVSELSPEDKNILVDIFRSEKIKCEKEFDSPELTPPVFDEEDIESESVMVDYKQIFPWTQDRFFSVGKTTYFVYDQYCLKTACDCCNSTLCFLGFHENETVPFNEKKPTAVSYTCDTGKWKTFETGKGAHPPSTLMKELFARYPDFRETLNERRNVLRLLYGRYKEKNGKKAIPAGSNPPAATDPTGRNDPCPCGSGKKFKKCCMNKAG